MKFTENQSSVSNAEAVEANFKKKLRFIYGFGGTSELNPLGLADPNGFIEGK